MRLLRSSFIQRVSRSVVHTILPARRPKPLEVWHVQRHIWRELVLHQRPNNVSASGISLAGILNRGVGKRERETSICRVGMLNRWLAEARIPPIRHDHVEFLRNPRSKMRFQASMVRIGGRVLFRHNIGPYLDMMWSCFLSVKLGLTNDAHLGRVLLTLNWAGSALLPQLPAPVKTILQGQPRKVRCPKHNTPLKS